MKRREEIIVQGGDFFFFIIRGWEEKGGFQPFFYYRYWERKKESQVTRAFPIAREGETPVNRGKRRKTTDVIVSKTSRERGKSGSCR